MRVLTVLIARVVFAVPMGFFGVSHFLKAGNMTGMVPQWLPYPIAWVYFTGACLIAAAIGIAVNKKGRMAAFLLAILILSFVLFVHVPGLSDEARKQFAMISLMKDIAIIGGALTLAGVMPPE
ncbi:MAG: DoxX family membrane protein [Spirochaetia bacterium]|nr:DoxX family membrane protein [Spirochaetia bacterium]